MRLKQGVKIIGMKPELIFGLMIVQEYFHDSKKELVITSVRDGKHSTTSLHYKGDACDIRIRDLDGLEATISAEDKQIANLMAKDLRERLGADFDIVVEGDHIHMEYDPK